jgi:hypothetical protein
MLVLVWKRSVVMGFSDDSTVALSIPWGEVVLFSVAVVVVVLAVGYLVIKYAVRNGVNESILGRVGKDEAEKRGISTSYESIFDDSSDSARDAGDHDDAEEPGVSSEPSN